MIYTLAPTDLPYIITYTVMLAGTGEMSNVADVSSDSGDPSDTDSSNNSSGVTITVQDDPIWGECGSLSGVGLYDLEGNGDGYDDYKNNFPDGTGLCML